MATTTFTAQVVQLLLLLSGNVELNPGPPTSGGDLTIATEGPSPVMRGLAELVAAAPASLKLIIATWHENNTANKNFKELDKATNADTSRELLAYLWNVDVTHESVVALSR